MKKRWLVAGSAVVAVFVVLVAAVSLVQGYFILAPGVHLRLNGEKKQEIAAYSGYNDPGATAQQGKNTLNVNITTEGTVNDKVPGSYTITYHMTYEGKEYTAERQVLVVDQERPELQLAGDTSITASKRELYKEPGFTAYDRCDGDLTASVEVSEALEEDVLTLTYRVKDRAGNTAELQRTVTIKDVVAPELLLNGGTVYMPVDSAYEEQGYSAVDDADGDLTEAVECSGSIDTHKAGTYTLCYTVKDQSGNTAAAERQVQVFDGKSGIGNPKNRIYLTFDDGPSDDVTVRILNTLAANHVKATFFILNYEESKRPILQRMIDEGHAIGIHGYSHDYATIYANDEAFMSNVYDLQKRLIDDFGYRSDIVRFPGGSSNTVSMQYNKGIMTRLARRLEAEGFAYFDWNISSEDAAGNNVPSSEIYANVTEGLSQDGYNVVLMHDTSAKSTTADALQAIIDYGRNHDYSFWPITSTMPAIHHRIAN